MKRRIYLASSWRNEYYPTVLGHLRALGHEVYDFRDPAAHFQWSEIDPDWQSWTVAQYRKALNHPLARRGFYADFQAMSAADTCVLLLPCGASAHSEAGYMAGEGKEVYIYIPELKEAELMYSMYTGIASSLEELEGWVGDATEAEAYS
jgi:hypothetical protein